MIDFDASLMRLATENSLQYKIENLLCSMKLIKISEIGQKVVKLTIILVATKDV